MTFTEAWKKEIWLKGLLIESRYEVRLVAGIATGAVVKGGSRSEVPAQVELERGCNTDNVPALRQLALKDEHGFVTHLGSRLH
uniref:Uncharacterized protein n=1 Tax=Tanacetum cinerariifolium TaxID=118510 RepID=A0A699K4V9_TANCI|nr:hypothetical protein [Tanacetum cinerariifolium]